MILVKKYIQKIPFISFPSQPHERIINILEMIIKNHLSHESKIKYGSIYRNEYNPHTVANFKITFKKGTRQTDSQPGN